ncbi:MAG: SlyX family protein [Pseudomonadota bacterium]|nr:SlyX family protein [Pseudomonadota bacterium]MEE2820509.1 SlyX family protein [Pseudomonadota bacterium]
MSQDTTVADLEIRIAFLEDQIDALNREMALLNGDRDQLTEELHALANLVRPLIEQMSQLAASDDSAPPPHY